jgi:hypothetical protein
VGRPGLDPGTLGLNVLVKLLRHGAVRVLRSRNRQMENALLFVYGMWFSSVWRSWNLTGMIAWRLEIVHEQLGQLVAPVGDRTSMQPE